MYGENNNGFVNGGMMNGGIPQGTGYQYNGMAPNNVPPLKNFLTEEEIQKLIHKDNTFSLAITETERLKATCNHRYNNGTDAIVETENGLCRCNICGHVFDPIDANTTKEDLIASIQTTLDILQTIKMIYLDMPEQTAREFFVMIPLLEKVPELFERAAKSYARYDNVNAYGYNNRNMNVMNMFAMLNGVLNGAPINMQQPQQGYTFPNYGYQQPMMSNGFVAQDPNMYNAQMTGFQYVPGQQPVAPNVPNMGAPAATPGQSQPVAQNATTDGQTVNVDATFKA